MKLQFFGHACFGITAGDVAVCIDPFEPSPLIDRPALPDQFTHWTATHGHFDHAARHAIPSAVEVVGEACVGTLRFERKQAAHDEFGGRLRGGMTDIIRVTDGDSNQVVVHCGDLGERPVGALLEWLGEVPIDVLIVPIGGYFTLGADGALELVRLLKPRAVVPCHAAEHGGRFPELASEELFLARVTYERRSGAVAVEAMDGVVVHGSSPTRRWSD